MGKRIIQQARGRGGPTYRVNKKAFIYKIKIPRDLSSEGEVVKILNSRAHTCPLAKINMNSGSFYIPAFKNMYEKLKINFEDKTIKDGNILALKDLPIKTKIYCIESKPYDGGKFVKSGGNNATVSRKNEKEVFVLMPSKKEKKFNPNCRAVVGVISGEERLEKPILKAGKQFYIKKSKSKLYPRTSPIKVNAIDHPFGSGRGKNPKSKIAKRNAPAGAKVGLIRPRRTGYKR